MFLDNNNIKLYLQDVTQIYIQLTSSLDQDFYIWIHSKLIILLAILSHLIIKAFKLLYEMLEAGNHRFATYYMDNKQKLR